MHGNRTAHRKTPQLVFGVVIILLGLIFILDHLEMFEAGSLTRYWPILLIIYGITRMTPGGGGRGLTSGVFFWVIGLLLLLKNLDVISVNLWDYWPVVLLFIGGMLVWRALRTRTGPGSAQEITDDSTVNTFVMFGGVERRNSSQDFKGGEITAILGGCELDLRGASIKDGTAVIDVFTFWGGIDIKVPKDWTVSVESVPLMGGCDDKTRSDGNASGKHLVIRGYVIMGGIEIG
jgi:predicted membrane protein